MISLLSVLLLINYYYHYCYLYHHFPDDDFDISYVLIFFSNLWPFILIDPRGGGVGGRGAKRS